MMDEARIKAATLVIHDNTRFDWDGCDAVARSVLAAADRAMSDHVMVRVDDLRHLLDLHMIEMGSGICFYDASWDEIPMIQRLYAVVKPSLAEICGEGIA